MMNMRTGNVLVLAVAAALFAAGCAGEVVEAPAVEIMADRDAPVTEAPREYGAGTVKTYNYTVNGETYEMAYTITQKREDNGNTVDFHTLSTPAKDPGDPCDAANNALGDAATLSYAACLKDEKLLAALGPNDGRFQWPLEAGKSWRADYQWIDKVVRPDWSGQGWQEFAVAAWEEVTVPAGTFKAYRVTRTNGDWETEKDEEYIIWYAPEPQMIVKVIATRSAEHGDGAADLSWELASYDVKYPPE